MTSKSACNSMLRLQPTKLTYLREAKFERYLGNGAFSNVMLYKLESREQQEQQNYDTVVVKHFKLKKLSLNKEEMRKQYNFQIQMLYHEFEMGSKLAHPNIIKTIDIDETNGCLIFENCVGIDFLDLLNEKKVPSRKELFQYFKQIIDGVEYLHHQGIAHMDMKLENVILQRESGIVKIIDFGYAKEFLNEKGYITFSEVCGTECYFPPEYFTNLKYNPDKVDMWCCGIILYNLIYDKMPWEHACTYKDKTFDIYKNKCKPEMPNMLFPDVSVYGFDDNDARIIYKVFAGLLEINHNKRFDVDMTIQTLN
jgi:serine/threonine protein kinase